MTHRCLLLGALLWAMVVAPAAASVRVGAVRDGLDQQPGPSLQAQPQSQEVLAASATYDDVSGSISASVQFANPVTFGEAALAQGLGERATLSFAGAHACSHNGAAVLTISLEARPADNGQPPISTAALAGFSGTEHADTTLSPDGTTLGATFTNPHFARQDLRCAGGTGFGQSPDGDAFSFYFDGYEPQEATPSTARAFLRIDLARRYGLAWTSSPRWVACAEPVDGVVDCLFRVTAGGGAMREGTVSVSGGDGPLVAGPIGLGRPFTRALKTCRIRRTLHEARTISKRSLRASGYLRCGDGPASLIRDLHTFTGSGVRRVRFHGVNTAHYADAYAFRCVVRRRASRYVATCSNHLDDRFVYAYNLGARP